jgi:hypothetical protein
MENIIKNWSTKHWTFQIEKDGVVLDESTVKVNKRPSLSLSVIEYSFKGKTNWFTGKKTWEPFVVVYEELEEKEVPKLWEWLNSNFDDSTGFVAFNKSNGILKLIDEAGIPIETWSIKGLCPTSVNFCGEICCNDDSVIPMQIEMTFVFDSASNISNHTTRPTRPEKKQLSMKWN